MNLPLMSYALKSSPGPQLGVNEDIVDVNLMNQIFIIADGFGGAGAGDVAVKFVKDKIIDFYTSSSSDPDATLPYFYDAKYIIELNVLVNGVHHAFKEFNKLNMTKPVNFRAGMSLIVSLYVDGIFMTIATGSCMAMLKRGKNISQIVTPDLIEKVNYEKENHISGLYPSDAFGLFGTLSLKISETKICSGDQIFLCTDGIYGYQSPEEIAYILSKNDLTNSQKIDETLDLANLRGNWDNQSATLLNF